MPLRLQIIAIILAMGFLIFTVRLIRKGNAEIRQMGKWLAVSVILVVGALFPGLGNEIAHFFEITTLTSLALFITTAILIVFSLTMHISLINRERENKKLIQEVSLMKKEIYDLQKHLNKEKNSE
ncbi:DUF2304 domain-containing protein [Enterococcus avium]|uniref:DUF2304 domain-containing protein n=1 Tax=Enterococcus avium TaxID=33945 RepID=UPI00288D37FF|nr:DUF2304 domain-containing protein [Enterococcus avium]MDT2435474.1 DUF2304 domain-containing protein [Enterococcus avium]MDT2466298.1 DUF2304 domain-containing protein [Enterococcus avium]MDT2505629.1 DUF2304 domain-containing protein [Enterococcus avium]